MNQTNFISKHLISIGFLLSILLLGAAMYYYPGGNLNDINALRYSFSQNYISHLMAERALNGMENHARLWAVAGVVIMGVTMGVAFIRFAKKVDIKHYSNVLHICGILLIINYILVTIPQLHNAMITVGSIIALLAFFYVTILLFRSKLRFLKVFAIFSLLCFYGATYMYSTRSALEYMPIVQKIVHVFQMMLLLGLEYFTKREDFENVAMKSRLNNR